MSSEITCMVGLGFPLKNYFVKYWQMYKQGPDISWFGKT